MRVRQVLAVALVVVLAATTAFAQGRGLGGGGDPGEEPRDPVDVSDFNPVRVMGPLEPIVDQPVIPGAEVTDQVYPEEIVLGVVIDGQARAYPLNMLTGPDREIINDQLGGRAIAATW